MDKDHVKATAKVTGGSVVGEPKTTTKTQMKGANMVVEVTTVFEVENPDRVFSLGGSGITMSLEAVN